MMCAQTRSNPKLPPEPTRKAWPGWYRTLPAHATMIRGDELVEILLVEDNPSDLQLTLHALERNKLANQIHVVRDGVEALDFLFSTGPYAERTPRNPRVVLLDLKLPRIDGLEVLRRMKEEPRTRTIPVV